MAHDFTDTILVLVCGGRDYDDRTFVNTVLNTVSPDYVVHGDARGADTLAKDWALNNGKAVYAHPAQWDRYGKSAGYKRNVEMLDSHPNIDAVIAFPGGRGTKMMIDLARGRGIMVIRPVPKSG